MKVDDDMKDYYQNHQSAYSDDAGIDIYVAENKIIHPNTYGNMIRTGIRVEMINALTNKNSSFFLAPRSSIYKIPLRLSQSPIIIDAGYRGELFICVDNTSDKPYIIAKGMRIVQIVAPTLDNIKVELVNELSNGSRGDKGLGSSGTHILSKL